MNMRERCRRIEATIMISSMHEANVDMLESFAREIRNEALEEAAKVAEARAEEWNGKIDPGTCAVISGAEADSCAFWIRRLQSKRICAPGCTHDREIGCEKPW